MLAETELLHVAETYRLIAPPKGAVFVDMGCGIGEVSRLMSAMDRSAKFYGVTNCRAQVKEIIKRGSVTPLRSDYHSVVLVDGCADVVMFNESIGYGDHDALVREAARMLKDGGILFIKDFSADDGNEEAFINWGYRTLSIENMGHILSSAGFEFKFHMPDINGKRYAEFYSASELMHSLHPSIQSTAKTTIWRCTKKEKSCLI